MTSQAQVTRRDSVHIDPRHHELYSQLSTGNEAPFKTMKDLFMLVASVGLARGRRGPLSGHREIFRWPVFSSQEDIPVLRAVAIAETGDTSVLVDQDQLLLIAAEYANAGIEEVRRGVASQPGILLENLIQFLLPLVSAGVGRADYFLTCDDRLVSRAEEIQAILVKRGISIRDMNPRAFLPLVMLTGGEGA